MKKIMDNIIKIIGVFVLILYALLPLFCIYAIWIEIPIVLKILLTIGMILTFITLDNNN